MIGEGVRLFQFKDIAGVILIIIIIIILLLTCLMPTVYQYKLVLLGESAVGKSSLVLRFVKNSFSEHQESTIGGRGND